MMTRILRREGQTALLCLLLLILTILLFLLLPPSNIEPGHTGSRPPTPTISIPADEWGRGDFKAAQAYADWCGGIVEDAPGGPYVINCDE